MPRSNPERASKYGAIPTRVDGVRFASKAEARRDAELQMLVRIGEISNLIRQPRFPLVVNGVKVGTYVGDWTYDEHGRVVVEDSKGVQTPVFRLKWAIAKAMYPELIWRLTGVKPKPARGRRRSVRSMREAEAA